jgi:hypothetical protein
VVVVDTPVVDVPVVDVPVVDVPAVDVPDFVAAVAAVMLVVVVALDELACARPALPVERETPTSPASIAPK